MDPNHRLWNAQQYALHDALSDPVQHPDWLSLFMVQHAQVHASEMAYSGTWSFVDDVLAGLGDGALRFIPAGSEHSIAWILWHLARCEDLTMNMLIAGADQVFESQGWKEKLHTPITHTGNELDIHEISRFSQVVDLAGLKAYRDAVGTSTREVVSHLAPPDLRRKVDPDRILCVRQSGSLLPSAGGIIDYWSQRTFAGLLLMPPTRHCFTHLNEALRIKKALHLS